MNMGNLYLTCDPNKLAQIIQTDMNTKIIAVSDTVDPNLMRTFNMVGASILVPPYQIMMMYAEGDLNNFRMGYISYLQEGPAAEYIAAILKAVISGINMVLYAPQDDIGAFGEPLQLYFGEMFGIPILNIDTNSVAPSQSNPNKYATMLNHMYFYTTLSAQEFIQLYPISSVALNETLLHKLIQDMKPAIPEPSCDNYRNYFINLMNSIQSHSTSFKQPVLFVK